MSKPYSATKKYLLQQELDSLKDEMAYAMQNANTAWVADSRMTMRMRETLERFYDWARRYEEASR